MRYTRIPLLLLAVFIISVHAVHTDEEAIHQALRMGTGLGANDLGDLAWDGSSLWVTGSGSLSAKLWGEGNKLTDWLSYRGEPGFGRGSMTALFASGDTLIVAWSYTEEFLGDQATFGDGLSISVDHGQTWRHVAVEDMFTDRTTNVGYYTTIYDITIEKNILWCSTTSGFLLKSEDFGYTWSYILPDDGALDLQNPNHHGQCVEVYGDTLWVGTFMGMNSSFDNGETWTNYSWSQDNVGNPDVVMPGNFCVAVERNVVDGKTHLWVGSMAFYGLGVDGICHSDDNGQTWEYKVTGHTAYNFAFGYDDPTSVLSDSTVFAASEIGLSVTHDLGETWELIDIRESEDLFWDEGTMVFGVIIVGGELWATSTDGIAKSNDWGETWHIFRGLNRVKTLDKGDRDVGISAIFEGVETYAFPNPFSPRRMDWDYSRTRIQYALTNDANITITVQDYSGKVIREVVSGEFRAGGRDYQDVWDGRDSSNEVVPNGVYFYVIKSNKGGSARGKIMVLD